MKDTIRTIYKELFSIKLLHNGYSQAAANPVGDNIRLQPDQETARYFTNYQLDCRLYADTFTCFTRSRQQAPPDLEPQESFISQPAGLYLRFLIRPSAGFLRNTFVVSAGSKWVYYFTNRVDQAENTGGTDFYFLNQDIAAHDMAGDYLAGTLVRSGGQLYTALRSIVAADNIAIGNADYWQPAGPVENVVSNTDLQPVESVNPKENCFGVIDIYNNGALNNNYALFDAGQQLLSPVYTLRFKSR